MCRAALYAFGAGHGSPVPIYGSPVPIRPVDPGLLAAKRISDPIPNLINLTLSLKLTNVVTLHRIIENGITAAVTNHRPTDHSPVPNVYRAALHATTFKRLNVIFQIAALVLSAASEVVLRACSIYVNRHR